MKTVTVSSRSTTLHKLLKQARRSGLILQSPDGQRFVLSPLGDWVGYNVGDSSDFAVEAKMTAANRRLMKDLADRRSHGKRVPIAEVRKRLGLK
jgi:hypothetical protein